LAQPLLGCESVLKLDLKAHIPEFQGGRIEIVASELHLQQLLASIEYNGAHYLISMDFADANKITFKA
jgi:hypothetical protein